MNDKNRTTYSKEHLIALAKISNLSITLNRLKLSSPSDFNSRLKHFSASLIENNPNSVLKATIYDCPVEGCDSQGHLNGSMKRHSSHETCPYFYKIKKGPTGSLTTMTDIDSINKIENKSKKKSTREHKELMLKNLKDIVFIENDLGNDKSTKINPECFGDLENLSASFVVNSLATDLASPFINEQQNKKKHEDEIESPFINDLEVSKFEFDLFQQSIAESSKLRKNIRDGGEIFNSTSHLKPSHKSHRIIKFGDYEVESWYNSPYPDEFWRLEQIFICQFCFKYMKSDWVLKRHSEKCILTHPPGREIYRQGVYSFFEVDGKSNKIYCQNLCLLAKLFVEHKTAYFDVEPFLFYILTRCNSSSGAFEMIGYFSKEKISRENNLSCILTLPQHMNKGFGNFLIDFSYLLSRTEGKVGTPEQPLSNLGIITYRSYWIKTLVGRLAAYTNLEISIKDLSIETGITMNDIISTLQYIGIIKYWKGRHIIITDDEVLNKYLKKKKNGYLKIDKNCLSWNI